MKFPRSSGILLHPVSLPGEYGIGDLGDEATRFIEFLSSAGQKLWQVLPLGPTGYGDSPYQGLSVFAGNPLLISPQRLVEMGLLSLDELKTEPTLPSDRVDYEGVKAFKAKVLKKAYDNYLLASDPTVCASFEQFCSAEGWWLDDWGLYRALKDANEERAWYDWEPELANREEQALTRVRENLAVEINAHKFYQFLFFTQWSSVKSQCHDRGISIIGDVPIFVAHDSVDVWAHPELFKLDDSKNPRVVAGVPPDFFSKTGQLWGNPIYDWERMRHEGFAWWVARIRAMFGIVDVIRLDHFRGFAAAWEVPFGSETAEHGEWVNSPGRQLFGTLRHVLGDLPIIAEDLGLITSDVEALRDEFGFPGMRILQFAFGGGADNIHLPHRHINNSVVYTGTHDNDTSRGWFASLTVRKITEANAHLARTREYCLKYLNSKGKEIEWDMIRAALASVSDLAVMPMQDVLGLGSEGRMNLPATKGGNWTWRFRPGVLTEKLSSRLRELSEVYGRTS